MFRAGDTLGPYTLVRKIGRGNFGVVWLAEKRSAIATTQFALKLPVDDDVDIESIKQEAALWSHVSGHPNILPIIEADIYEEQIVIASEYAPDGSLAEWLKSNGSKAPSIKAAIEMTSGILAGLDRLHSKNIIHRDLKPRNILLQGETPRLADFGLARLLKSSVQSNLIAGTPAYMAPEAFKGVRSEQTDLWSAAIIFYEMLAGYLPYLQQEAESLAWAIVHEAPDAPPPSVPGPLAEIIKRALRREPADRYRSAAEMREALADAALTVITAQRQAMTVSMAESAAASDGSGVEGSGPASPEARAETKLIPDRVKQLMTEGATAFGGGQFALAVEKWELALKLSPDEPTIKNSLQSARERLRASEERSKAQDKSVQDGASDPSAYWTIAAGPQAARMQPETPEAQQSGMLAAQSAQSFTQAQASSAQYDTVAPLSQAQATAVKKRRSPARLIFVLVMLVVAGAAAAAVFYFKIFETKNSITVSKEGKGDYKTINEAIKKATPGSRILVEPGTYLESLVLDRQVEIIANAASNNSVIIESLDAPAVVMKTEQATLRGLTLRARTKTSGSKQFAVDIAQGKLLIETCNITSDSLASIGVHGAMTNPTIRASVMREGQSAGIIFFEKAQGTVENCEIAANAASGIEIKDGANPTIRNTNIYGGAAHGIFVTGGGSGSIEDCDISGHQGADVAVSSRGNPTFKRGRIHDGRSAGLSVYDGGQGMFEGVEIRASAAANVEIKDSSNPILRGCDIQGGKSVGVHISGKSQGAIEQCKIHDYPAFGVKVEESNPVIRGSEIYACKDAAIQVAKNSMLTVEATDIHHITGIGVQVHESRISLERCKVHECAAEDAKAEGIVLINTARASINDCDIFNNQNSGVAVYSGCNVEVRSSRIKNNREAALWAGALAEGAVVDCDLTGNARGSWLFEIEGQVSRVENHNNKEDTPPTG